MRGQRKNNVFCLSLLPLLARVQNSLLSSAGQRRKNSFVAYAPPLGRGSFFDIRKELGEVFPRHAPKAKELDAWRVDDGAASVQRIASGRRCRMPALVCIAADVADAEL